MSATSAARRHRLQQLAALALCLGLSAIGKASDDAAMAEERDRLVSQIQAEVKATAREIGFDRLSPAVERAMRTVPRHRFVPDRARDLAYINSPLPIGGGQTISQPYIVAIMSQLLDVGPGERVLELGTGSGYQAAVLAEMGVEVYSIEIVPELADRAARTLESMGYDKVHVRAGDGWLGWPEAAPFDGIIVTAAAPRIPQRLVDQLAEDGRLLIPLGAPNEIQQLALFTKDETGALIRTNLLPVRFVPVTGSMDQ